MAFVKQFGSKAKDTQTLLPAISLLAMHADMHQETYIRMFITALFIKDKNWKQTI